MGLLSSTIKNRTKLSLRDAKIAPEQRALASEEPVKEIERPITEEDKAYTKLLQVNPALGKLVDTFGLVGKDSGRELRDTSTETTGDPQQEPKVKEGAEYKPTPKKPVEAIKTPNTKRNFSKLFSLAHQVLKESDSITKEEILENLQEQTKVNRERAEIGFNMMLEEDIIIQVNQLNKYYLNGSTPF